MNQTKKVINAALKYIIIAIVGVILFYVTHRAALPERPSGGIGGEAFFLILPLFWWIVERVVKDFINNMKRQWVEIKAESETKSEDEEGSENK